MASSVEWEEMVFTERIDLDILHQDHVVALFAEDCVPDDVVGVLVHSLEEEFECLLDPFRGFEESLPVGVFP